MRSNPQEKRKTSPISGSGEGSPGFKKANLLQASAVPLTLVSFRCFAFSPDTPRTIGQASALTKWVGGWKGSGGCKRAALDT